MRTKIVTLCITLGAVVSTTRVARADCTSNSPCFSQQNFGQGWAIYGKNAVNGAIEGDSSGSPGIGVFGQSDSGPGVKGSANSGYGGYFSAGTGYAVYATTTGATFGVPIYGQSASPNPSIYGAATGTGTGVYGVTTSASGGNGVWGESANSGASGVYGHNSGSGYGVAGRSTGSGKAVLGDNTDSLGWAGYFTGKLFANSGYKPGGGSWTDSSDIRMKKNVKPLEGALERLLKLQGVTFEWIAPEKHGDMSGRQTGMIAQEVEKVFPEWIGTDANGFKTLTFRGFEALSVEGMRVLRNENQALLLRVSTLEERLKKLESNRPIAAAGFSAGTLGMFATVAVALGMLVASRRRDRRRASVRPELNR